VELARRCKEAVASLGSEQGVDYELIGDELKEKNGREATVEDVLSSVREKIAAMTDADTLSGVGRAELIAIEAEMRKTIAAAATGSPLDPAMEDPWLGQLVLGKGGRRRQTDRSRSRRSRGRADLPLRPQVRHL
jgi:hypothetical protein